MKRRQLAIVVIFLFILIFLLKGEGIFFTIFRPIQKIFYHPSNQFPTEDICRQISIENAKLKIVEQENEILRDHLNFIKKAGGNFVLANIIGQRLESGYHWFLLDQGSEQGIEPGLAVVDQQGILIGIIAKVQKSISYLTPVFDRKFSLAADIIPNQIFQDFGNTNAEKQKIISGIIEGEYGLNLKMKYVSSDKEISSGDTVVTTGVEENIRWGIIIGQVSRVEKKPNAVFQEITVKPLFTPNFKIVSVILSQ